MDFHAVRSVTSPPGDGTTCHLRKSCSHLRDVQLLEFRRTLGGQHNCEALHYDVTNSASASFRLCSLLPSMQHKRQAATTAPFRAAESRAASRRASPNRSRTEHQRQGVTRGGRWGSSGRAPGKRAFRSCEGRMLEQRPAVPVVAGQQLI